MEELEFLGSLAPFVSLDSAVLLLLCAGACWRQLSSKELLFRAGQACRGLYVIGNGRVKAYRAGAGGREQIVHWFGRGELIGEVAFIDSGPHLSSAMAVEPTRVLHLPAESVRMACEKSPELVTRFAALLAARLRHATELLEWIALREVPSRVAAALLSCAREAGAISPPCGFALPYTQEQLAHELATSRESVARALRLLEDDGLVHRRGQWIRIVDADRLAQVAEQGVPRRVESKTDFR